MNRSEYYGLLADIEHELTLPGGHFDALFGHDEKTLEQARFVAAVALMAADRFYSQLSRLAFLQREREEKRAREGSNRE